MVDEHADAGAPNHEGLDGILDVPLSPDGRGTAHVPPGWEQGRGAFGGVVLGLLAQAMETHAAAHDDGDRPLWTLNGEIPAPVVDGEAVIEVRRLRRGSAVSAYEASLRQGQGEGEVRARASAILGSHRPVGLDVLAIDPPAPAVAGDWAAVPEAPASPMMPSFIQHLELRPVLGAPFTGAPEPRVEGWVRLRQPPAELGAAALVALIDTYWPALFPVLTAPRPMATVAFGFHRTGQAPADPTAPVYFRGRAVVSAGGFALEQRELWAPGGTLLAVNPQTAAIIK